MLQSDGQSFEQLSSMVQVEFGKAFVAECSGPKGQAHWPLKHLLGNLRQFRSQTPASHLFSQSASVLHLLLLS
jgi:hypothetical protein